MHGNGERKQAEAILLGQVLQDNNIFYSLRTGIDHFENGSHRKIYQAIRDILEAGDKANLVTVSDMLREDVSASYIASLTSLTPTTANFEFYEKKIIRESIRKVARDSAIKLREVLEAGQDPDEALAVFEVTTLKARQLKAEDRLFRCKDISLEYTRKLEDRFAAGGELPGYRTGFPRLDSLLLGLQDRRLYYIGGRPSMGKSALLLNIAANIARKEVPVGVISLESSRLELMDRLTASLAQVNSKMLQTGTFPSQQVFKKVLDVQEKIHDLPIVFYDKANCTLFDLKVNARRMVGQYNVKVLFVDYLQLITVPGKDKVERVGTASLELKGLARELDVPIVCAAQLGRECDTRRPQLGDFQWSSQAEQDADCSILIHWLPPEEGEIPKVLLYVAKNRDGELGVVKTRYQGSYVTFREE